MRGLAYEYRSRSVTFQCLDPVYVATRMTQYSASLSSPSLTIPSATTYARHALATLGWAAETPGYWPHTLQVTVTINLTANCLTHTHTHTHTHTFNGPFSGTTQVSRYQKGKTNLDFTEARDSEWQWNLLDNMQVCTSLQTDNHASTQPLSFLQAGCPSCRPTNNVTSCLIARYKYSY